MPKAPSSQQLRDRQECLYGPSLLDCSEAPAQPDWLAPLIQLDVGTSFPVRQDNIDQTNGKNRRLGHYFEALWQQILTDANWRYCASLPITHERQPLGELDFLIETPTGNQYHLELALKFFLAGPDGWIGPDGRDTLNTKLERLFQHQLTLPQQPAVRQQLQALGWDRLQSQALLRGYLFYPAHPAAVPRLPEMINPQHRQGLWTFWPAGKAYLPDGLWYVLDKAFWTSPAVVTSAVNRDYLERYLDLHFRYVGSPVCVLQVQPGPTGFRESQRWILVNHHWPARNL